MASYKIFVVEDDDWYSQILQYNLSLNPDYEIHFFANGADCLNSIHLNPDIITIDYSLPDMTGDKLFIKIKEINDSLPVIFISSQLEIPVVVKLLKLGVYDYFVKDENTKDLLWNSIIKSRETHNLKTEIDSLKTQLKVKYNYKSNIIGNSPAVNKVMELVSKSAQTNINVSINGETGTGKEVIAKAIHFSSPRASQPFVAINMAAIPKELLESELFGHEKGSFTGAASSKAGKFEEANNGTLFLDEIAEMDLNLQSKILRVIQEREFSRVGSNKVVKLNVRLITASHKNLLDEVGKGNFREDLYYRIIGFPIQLPPLRDRGNDILLLARHFADDFCKENNLSSLNFSTGASNALMRHHYPGNVRELKSIMELAAVMSNGGEIAEGDIQITPSRSNIAANDIDRTMKEHMSEIIAHYLKKYNNNVQKTATTLNIGKSTIYEMLKNDGIKLNDRFK
ncbi:MAG: sigma-54-dependent transcriptional regulator [Bacteroidia bacterium]